MGELILRRRQIAALDGLEVLEVKLGEEFLMSSLFHAVEEALAELGLAKVQGDALDVVVGGLGLGYTAAAALREDRVRELLVIETMPAVIHWHREGIVPLGRNLTADPRCRFVEGDFFALAANPEAGFDPVSPGRHFDAVLLDIDHSPEKLLHRSHAAFYSRIGLEKLSMHLRPDGIFALWSDDPPDDAFLAELATVFAGTHAQVVHFFNPLLERDSSSTLYFGTTVWKSPP